MAQSRLRLRFEEALVPQLQQELGDKNRLSVPRVTRVVISMGIKTASSDAKRLEAALNDLATIAGQKPVVTKARNAISGFRLREGMEVGCFVTLRRERMYEFLDRLISVALPRVRDFRGLNPKSFDGRGNFSFGLSEQGIFPEIDGDRIAYAQGMNITIVTSAGTNDRGRALLKAIGVPFKRPE